MTKLEVWLLRWLVRNIIRRCMWQKPLEQMYETIREEALQAFYEDNVRTTEVYLRERFEASNRTARRKEAEEIKAAM